MRVDRLRQRLAELVRLAVDDLDPLALDRIHRRQHPELPQPDIRAAGQVHARGIGAVDNVEVVIAGKDQHLAHEFGVGRDHVEELGPFARDPGIGHIAADEDDVDRGLGVDLIELGENPFEAEIAARPQTPALEPEAIVGRDDVHVG